MVLLTMIVTILLSENILLQEGFEDDSVFLESSDWLVDRLVNDELAPWVHRTASDGITPYDGNGVAASASHCDGACAPPVNIMVTPRIAIPEDANYAWLRFYVAAEYPEQYEETLEIRISTHENQEWQPEYGLDDVVVLDSPDWTLVEIDLALHIGESIYIMFKHIFDEELNPYNTLLLDDIELVSDGTLSNTDISMVPKASNLKGNYPNPFNPSTTISFFNATAGNVQIDVFNLKGQKVTTLTDKTYDKGEHTVHWNGTDSSGRSVTSGVYLYQMRKDDFIATKKMILMK